MPKRIVKAIYWQRPVDKDGVKHHFLHMQGTEVEVTAAEAKEGDKNGTFEPTTKDAAAEQDKAVAEAEAKRLADEQAAFAKVVPVPDSPQA